MIVGQLEFGIYSQAKSNVLIKFKVNWVLKRSKWKLFYMFKFILLIKIIFMLWLKLEISILLKQWMDLFILKMLQLYNLILIGHVIKKIVICLSFQITVKHHYLIYLLDVKIILILIEIHHKMTKVYPKSKIK